MFWENILDGVVAEKVLAGDEASAQGMLLGLLENDKPGQPGEVYLVGAGPGDPDLLTFRALRLMQKADVVVYDNLVSRQILDMVRRDATRIYAGKKRDDHAMPQEEINELLVRLAKQGKRVLRLKGGDPFIFGRGGEEIEMLAEHGILFQVVPGITAASGVSAYAGIPLTHRDHAQSCIFVTGHLKDGSVNLDWDALARPKQTIVVYMGLHGLATLCTELIAHGLPENTPAAIVQQGTTQNQRVMTGTLATLPGIAQTEKLQAPTLIIIGGVVTLREKLAWFNPSAATKNSG
jgi:uroporphyrin-III C-methyltransferase/precorrin-2 dehydrogenase/sirohydrochlorin ferrochelatase